MAAVPGSRRFAPAVVRALQDAKILGVRAGERSDHRFTGIWVVVVQGRAFGRSWTLSPDGSYQSFRRERRGTIQVGDRRVRVEGKPVRSARLLDAIEAAYAEKDSTPASKTSVRGFRSPRRRAATLEFVPAATRR